MGACMPVPTERGWRLLPERNMVWALGVSPLLICVFQFLFYTPSSVEAAKSGLLYGAASAGSIAGCLVCMAAARRGGGPSRALTVGFGCILEAAWIILLVDYRAQGLPTCIASFFVGASAVGLLVLWACVGRSKSLRCELAQCALAVAVAFATQMVFNGALNLSFLSHACTVLTTALLVVFQTKLRDDPGAGGMRKQRGGDVRHRSRNSSGLLNMVVVGILGAGLAVLGHGGHHIEYAAGLLCVMAAVPLFVRGERFFSLLGIEALPASMVALCAAALLDSMVPFVLYMAAMCLFLMWAVLCARVEGQMLAAAELGETARSVLWIAVALAVGFAAACCALRASGCTMVQACMVLVALLAVAGYAWLAVLFVFDNQAYSDRVPVEEDVRGVFAAWGFSPREAQVGQLLYEGHSLDEICRALDMAEGTAKTHVRHIYEKSGTHSKVELHMAVNKRLGSPDRA